MRIIILHQLRIAHHRYRLRKRVLSKLPEQVDRGIVIRRWRYRIGIKRIRYHGRVEEIEE